MASETLPELQKIVSANSIDSPMMLWVELNLEFERECERPEPNFDLLKRVWSYSQWCLKAGSDEVRTAAVLAFCEHLLDTESRARVLTKLISRADLLSLREILLYHNSAEQIEHWLSKF